MADTKTLTRCTQVTGVVGGTGPWAGYPAVCAVLAAGPHPDPEKGYREPLCRWHLADALAKWGQP